MASEYLKWKYRDVKPGEQSTPLTGRERRANWWHYHKWHVLVGLVLILALADILWHVLGIGVTEPDYQIAYVGAAPCRRRPPSPCKTRWPRWDRTATGMVSKGELERAGAPPRMG